MARNSVGIYISSKNVDIVELSGSIHAPRLLNFIRKEIPPTATQESKEGQEKKEISHRESVSTAIKEGLEGLNIKPASVYTVLPTGDVMIRSFSMPYLPKTEQAQAVRFEVRKYIPFKIEKVASDFKVLSPPSGSKKTMEVFFIAATKENLNAHIDMFKKAGTDAIGVDIVPFSLVQVLFLCKKVSARDNAALLYIDNDTESVSIHIIERGIPFLSRDMKINTDDKEALFEKIASELRVSFDYYRRQKPQAELSKVVVCGEKLFEGLDAFIANELKVITERLESFTGVRGAERLSSSSIVAVGAALRGLGRSYYSVNLSPIAVVRKKRKITNILLLESIAAIFIIIGVFLLTSFQLKNMSTELRRITEKGKDLPADTAGFDAGVLKALGDNTLKELGFLQLLLNNRISWAEKMDRFTRDIPKDVWISKLSVQDELIKSGPEYPSGLTRSISISGSAFSFGSPTKEMDDIYIFLDTLKKDEVFMRFLDNLKLGPIDEKRVENHIVSSFEITAGKQVSIEKSAKWQRRR